MSVHNSKKRPASSQGGPATKKVNIQSSKVEGRGKGKSKGRIASEKEVKSPVKKLHKEQQKATEPAGVRGGKRAVPVTESIDKMESDSEDDGASEMDEDDVEMDVEPEEDGKGGITSNKDPNGVSGPVSILLLCMKSRE